MEDLTNTQIESIEKVEEFDTLDPVSEKTPLLVIDQSYFVYPNGGGGGGGEKGDSDDGEEESEANAPSPGDATEGKTNPGNSAEDDAFEDLLKGRRDPFNMEKEMAIIEGTWETSPTKRRFT